MDIPDDQYELYAEFGIAAEKAQALEIDAGNVALSYLAFLVDRNKITDEQREFFKSFVDGVDRQTLGRLLKDIRSIGTFDQSILQVTDEALERRNYLTHKFFRTHNFAIFDAAGRKLMIEELKDIQIKIDRARAMLHGVSETMDMLAGRGGQTATISKKLQAEGKRVKI